MVAVRKPRRRVGPSDTGTPCPRINAKGNRVPLAKRPITGERSGLEEKNCTRENRDSCGAGEGAEDGGEGHESSKGERMGLDGKLTRSLLPGALGAENKEKETEIVREREGGERRKRSRGDRESHR